MFSFAIIESLYEIRVRRHLGVTISVRKMHKNCAKFIIVVVVAGDVFIADFLRAGEWYVLFFKHLKDIYLRGHL